MANWSKLVDSRAYDPTNLVLTSNGGTSTITSQTQSDYTIGAGGYYCFFNVKLIITQAVATCTILTLTAPVAMKALSNMPVGTGIVYDNVAAAIRNVSAERAVSADNINILLPVALSIGAGHVLNLTGQYPILRS